MDNPFGSLFTIRGLANIGCLILLGAGLLVLFVGYPIISYVDKQVAAAAQTSTAPPPDMTFRQLIDTDTPEAAKKIADKRDGKDWTLVFSDEFETDGRSFYPGDEPVSSVTPTASSHMRLQHYMHSTGKPVCSNKQPLITCLLSFLVSEPSLLANKQFGVV